MRMWNVNPAMLCRQHLLGEHNEIHKALGNLRHSGSWTRALTAKGFLEPQNFVKRHAQLVREMLRRGYRHASPLDVSGIDLPEGKIDVDMSIKDLQSRCEECFKECE